MHLLWSVACVCPHTRNCINIGPKVPWETPRAKSEMACHHAEERQHEVGHARSQWAKPFQKHKPEPS